MPPEVRVPISFLEDLKKRGLSPDEATAELEKFVQEKRLFAEEQELALPQGVAALQATQPPIEGAGELAGGVVGGVAAGPLGAAAGGGIGQLFEEAQRHLINGESLTYGDSFERVGAAMLRQGTLDAAAIPVMRAMHPLLAPIAKRLLRVSKEFTEEGTFFFKMTGGKGRFSLGQASDSGLVDFLDEVSRSAFLSLPKATRFKTGQVKQTKALVANFLERFAKEIPPDDGAELVARWVVDAQAVKRAFAEKMYRVVDDALPSSALELPIKTPQFKGGFNAALKRVEREEIVLSRELLDIAKRVKELPSGKGATISFQKAESLRRNIRSLEGFERKTLQPYIDRTLQPALDKAAKEVGVEGAYRAAREVFEESIVQFEPKLIKQLLEANPGAVAREIFSASNIKSLAPKDVDALYKLVPKSQRFRFQGQVLRNAIANAGERGGFLNGAKMLDFLNEVPPGVLEKLYPDTFKGLGATRSFELLQRTPQAFGEFPTKLLPSDDMLKNFLLTSRVLKRLGDKQGEGTGRMLIQLMQFTAATTIGGAAVGGLFGESVTAKAGGLGISMMIIFGPRALLSVMTSKVGARLFIDAAATPLESSIGRAGGIKLVAFALRNMLEEDAPPPGSKMRMADIPLPGELDSIGPELQQVLEQAREGRNPIHLP